MSCFSVGQFWFDLFPVSGREYFFLFVCRVMCLFNELGVALDMVSRCGQRRVSGQGY